VLCGAGDDARPLARIASEVGFQVTVVDRRPAVLAPDRYPRDVRRLESDGAELLDRVPLGETSYVVVMTHSFAHDQAYLAAILETPAAYIGILGPRRRTERLLAALEERPPRVYGPVGLDVGAEGAEQVAVAIVAELLAVRSGRRPRSLRERSTAIHAHAVG
jgi:xanthine/CO dehydrogenase XdhC/CoxF family maturation factor